MVAALDSDRRYFTLHCRMGSGDSSDLVGREAAISSTGTRPTGSNRCGVRHLGSKGGNLVYRGRQNLLNTQGESR